MVLPNYVCAQSGMSFARKLTGVTTNDDKQLRDLRHACKQGVVIAAFADMAETTEITKTDRVQNIGSAETLYCAL